MIYHSIVTLVTTSPLLYDGSTQRKIGATVVAPSDFQSDGYLKSLYKRLSDMISLAHARALAHLHVYARVYVCPSEF